MMLVGYVGYAEPRGNTAARATGTAQHSRHSTTQQAQHSTAPQHHTAQHKHTQGGALNIPETGTRLNGRGGTRTG